MKKSILAIVLASLPMLSISATTDQCSAVRDDGTTNCDLAAQMALGITQGLQAPRVVDGVTVMPASSSKGMVILPVKVSEETLEKEVTELINYRKRMSLPAMNSQALLDLVGENSLTATRKSICGAFGAQSNSVTKDGINMRIDMYSPNNKPIKSVAILPC
jgi:hypothetical protein